MYIRIGPPQPTHLPTARMPATPIHTHINQSIINQSINQPSNQPTNPPPPPQANIIECGPTCACQEGCGLRKTGRGLGVPVEVRWTGNRGWGVFTRTAVRKGTYVANYMGEILSEERARERYNAIVSLGGNPDYQGVWRGLWVWVLVGWVGGWGGGWFGLFTHGL
jgi:hypothetical protein